MALRHVIVLLVPVALTMANQETVIRTNYGVVFEPAGSMQAVEDYWTHTIQIAFPKPVWRDVKLNICKNLGSKSLCESVQPIKNQLKNMQTRTQKRLDKLFEQQMEIFEQQPFFKVKNRAVSPVSNNNFKYDEEITKMFNSVTNKDVITLQKHINELEDDDEEISDVKIHGTPFSSVTKRQIPDIHIIMKSIEQNHDQLEQYADLFAAEFTKYSEVIAILSDVQSKLDTLEDEVHTLFEHMSLLCIGKLSPMLVPPGMMKGIIQKVQSHLSETFPNFVVALPNPSFQYQRPDMFYMRHGTNMYITLKFPIVNSHSNLHVYKLETFPEPIDPNGTIPHSTQLLDAPDYMVISDDGNYHASLSAAQFAECKGFKLLHCPFPIPLVSVKEPSCALALYKDMGDAVEYLCDFRFMQGHVAPAIRQLSMTHVLVSNSSGISVLCQNTRITHPGCMYCVIEVPCQCSLTSGSFYVAPRITDCRNHSAVSIVHPVNMPVIQQFTNHRAKRELRGDTMLSQPLQYELPKFDLYSHRLAGSMANDKVEHLSLKKVAEAVRKGQPVYSTLAERMLNGDIEIIQPWWSASSLWDMGNLLLTILSCSFTIYLFFKVKELRRFVIPDAIAERHDEHKGPVSKMF